MTELIVFAPCGVLIFFTLMGLLLAYCVLKIPDIDGE